MHSRPLLSPSAPLHPPLPSPSLALGWCPRPHISYETAKHRLAHSGRFGGPGEETTAVHLLAGLAAEIGASFLWTPFDVIKQRLQVRARPSLAGWVTDPPWPAPL